MTFRNKLLLLLTATVVLGVALVAAGVSIASRRAFEQLDEQRTDALVAQFQREFARRGDEVKRRIEAIAGDENTIRMAIDLSRPQADASLYVNDARGLAASHQLDFLEFLADDGTIISSAQWFAHVGYKEDWVTGNANWPSAGGFLRREDTPEGAELGLEAVAVVPVGERKLYVVGGQRLGRDFLASLVLPAGMRALLYTNLDADFVPGSLADVNGPLEQANLLEPLINQVRQQRQRASETVWWTRDAASAELFQALPLIGRHNDLLGVLLVGSSRREIVQLERRIRWLALGVALAGVLIGLIASGWAAARVTRPVEMLAAGAREVAGGNWSVRVDARAKGEIGELAEAFNQMTRQLTEQRDRLVQAERVAAWRELARRLAHELKNPLFPMQITLENLRRAREQNPEQFDEVFRESSATLLAELENLKTIVGRFSDFAKMPPPELQPVQLNEVVRSTVRLFDAQFSTVGRPGITPELYLDEKLPAIQADPDLLRRALENLILNAMDAMPSGGTLTLRTVGHDGAARLEISDTGSGLTREECERLFTPYYTTKQHGTGLGLALVQSVVSDHSGKISVESEPGMGTTIRIELPARPARREPAAVRAGAGV